MPFKCPHCDQSCVSNQGLRQHINSRPKCLRSDQQSAGIFVHGGLLPSEFAKKPHKIAEDTADWRSVFHSNKKLKRSSQGGTTSSEFGDLQKRFRKEALRNELLEALIRKSSGLSEMSLGNKQEEGEHSHPNPESSEENSEVDLQNPDVEDQNPEVDGELVLQGPEDREYGPGERYYHNPVFVCP
jgi:hypothetical protein